MEDRIIHRWNDSTFMPEGKGKVKDCSEFLRFVGNHGDRTNFELGRKLVFDFSPGYDPGLAVSHLFFRFGLEGGDGVGVFSGDVWAPAQGGNYLFHIPIFPQSTGHPCCAQSFNIGFVAW